MQYHDDTVHFFEPVTRVGAVDDFAFAWQALKIEFAYKGFKAASGIDNLDNFCSGIHIGLGRFTSITCSQTHMDSWQIDQVIPLLI